MLTVWGVCNGAKYSDEDVRILRAMVARNMREPHRFRCLADRPINGVDCLVLDEQWPGWWAKLQLFRVEQGPSLYLDLDCVVVGALDDLLSDVLSMPANWAQSGHGGCQSSVMSWRGDYSWVAAQFEPSQISAPENGNCGAYGLRKLWGDQEYITSVAGDPGGGIIRPMRGVVSYKYHCREGLPSGARAVAFHGDPKPAQVSDAWVRRARSFTAIP